MKLASVVAAGTEPSEMMLVTLKDCAVAERLAAASARMAIFLREVLGAIEDAKDAMLQGRGAENSCCMGPHVCSLSAK